MQKVSTDLLRFVNLIWMTKVFCFRRANETPNQQPHRRARVAANCKTITTKNLAITAP
jgi:hypothetical protein